MSRTREKTVCTVQAVTYYGTHQGYKVRDRGIKYPRERGCWYATNSILCAIEAAFRERVQMADRRYDIVTNKLDAEKSSIR